MSRYLVIVFLILLAPQFSTARLMKAEEAEVSIIEETVKIRVSADGSSIYKVLEKVKILNETGRTNWGTRHLNYSPKNARFKVEAASTQVGETNYSVERHDIVDTEINATENGFDESRQVLVPFRKVEVGSILSLKTQKEVFRPPFERQYSDRFYVGDYYLQEHLNIEMDSEIPLYFEFNDPNAHLEFTKSEKTGHYVYWIRLKHSLLQRPIEEIRSRPEDLKFTWFQVSSVLKTEEVVRPIAKLYDQILAQDLPKIFESIVQEAKREVNPLDQINFILAAVSEKIRYMGDWRAIDGAYVPRSLKLIGDTHFGDCKDLATLMVKMLRALGFESDVAWVFRGKTSPAISEFGYVNFNHAIVSVILKDRQLWLDPTNFQSFAQGVFEDIAERKALVLSPKKIEFRRVEFLPFNESREITHESTSIEANSIRTNLINVEYSGAFALSMTGAELKDSKEQFEKSFIDLYVSISDLIKFKFEPFLLKSRIVKPLQFKFSIDAQFHPTETSLGQALEFAPPQIIRDITNIDRGNRVSDLQLEIPSEAANIFTLVNMHGKGKGLKDCKIKSPWMDYTFAVSEKLNQVTRQLVIKKYVVKVAEVKSKLFEDFQNEVRRCSLSKFLVLDLNLK